MQQKINIVFLLIFFLFSSVFVRGQDAPVIIEAESGTFGPVPTPPIFAVLNDGATAFVRVQGNFITNVTQAPGSDSRVITYSVTFPRAGVYDLYARIRVGPGNDNDDSYYYPTGFGVKSFTDVNDWITANNLNSAGSTVITETVTGSPGSAGTNVWKWVNMSELVNGGETPVSFTVPASALTQTFQIGSRENGLDIDKLAFGPADNYFTVFNLDNGQPGTVTPPPPPFTPSGPPMAAGKPKFIGGVYSASQFQNFTAYWNQVVPENAGKWGSVEGTRDVMNWTELDSAYQLAQRNGFPFRYHTLLWGNQQPAWIETLPPAEQLEEIREWFAAVAARYPKLDLIEVVNEPLHDPPGSPGNGGGNYINALGGNGATGWDWVIRAFELAREYFPNAKLMVNDYSIINSNASTTQYLNLIGLLKQRGLIDAIGEQGHAFTTRGTPAATMTANLTRLGETGLPVYITEFEIDGPTDQIQLDEYKRVIPVLWEHPAVRGITTWGYRPGLWRNAQGAYIVLTNGAERPAMVWLKRYISNNMPVITASQRFEVSETAQAGMAIGKIIATDADQGNALQSWKITSGNADSLFRIDSASGTISLNKASVLDFEKNTTYTLGVTVSDSFSTSAAGNITVQVRNENDNVPWITEPLNISANRYMLNNTVIGTVKAEDNDDTNQPGFTRFQNWQVTGGTGAGIFDIHPNTGQVRLRNGLLLILTNRSAYTLWVRVSDGIHLSEAKEVTISVVNRISICHAGTTMNVSLTDALTHLFHGDYLGSCGSGGSTASVLSDIAEIQSMLAAANMDNTVKIYPNPVTDQINIFLGTNDQNIRRIDLMDMTGRLHQSVHVNQRSNLIIYRGSLKPGVYLLSMQGDKVFTKKIVIK